jgi:hypothetical protein
MRRYVLLGIFCIGLLTPQAWGASVIDFNMDAIHPDNIYIGINEMDHSLNGNHIGVDLLQGIGIPNSVTYAVDAELSFQTAPPTGTWQWGPGDASFIKIAGSIDTNKDDAFDSDDEVYNESILYGDFKQANVNSTGGVFEIIGGAFDDYKHEWVTSMVLRWEVLSIISPRGPSSPVD